MNTVNVNRSIDAALGTEINALLAAYTEILDEDRLEEWPQLFIEDGMYRVLSLENVKRDLAAPILYLYSRGMLQDRVTALRDALTYEFVYSRHICGLATWCPDADEDIRVRSNFSLFQTTEEGVTRTFAVGQYQDVLTRVEGALRFRRRDVILDSFGVLNNISVPL